MYNFQLVEDTYNKIIKNVEFWIPEDIYYVNLELLQHYDLLQFQPPINQIDPVENRLFNILETPEKITLINNEFVIWIIPNDTDSRMLTQVLIALNKGEEEPQLVAAFVASGVYNSSRLVLRVLDKFLIEIHDAELALSKFKKTS